jgi:glutamine synthetase
VYEAALTYDEVQRAADGAALFKTCVKQIVSRRGLSATFMAKVSEQLPGSSGHLHQSLWREGRNVFHSAAPGTLSKELSGYLGGVLTLLPAITALLSPTVNSYKRFVPGLWAPLTASWGMDNRTTALRVLETDSPKAARIECRQTAADINPFVAMAACLAAGLWGIEQGLEAPPATAGDAGGSGASLPATLGDATDRMMASEVVSDLLGRQFVEHYAMTRRWEESQYRRAVTDWERQRYFELI